MNPAVLRRRLLASLKMSENGTRPPCRSKPARLPIASLAARRLRRSLVRRAEVLLEELAGALLALIGEDDRLRLGRGIRDPPARVEPVEHFPCVSLPGAVPAPLLEGRQVQQRQRHLVDLCPVDRHGRSSFWRRGTSRGSSTPLPDDLGTGAQAVEMNHISIRAIPPAAGRLLQDPERLEERDALRRRRLGRFEHLDDARDRHDWAPRQELEQPGRRERGPLRGQNALPIARDEPIEVARRRGGLLRDLRDSLEKEPAPRLPAPGVIASAAATPAETAAPAPTARAAADGA